ncbi:hypothetical protein H2198_002090 [Neophaeococcomyces mojaviensis]|uniref:Uncharacterized protein n=1 Tax=Neophaeococcomyces mojaviensis TaxID=3383035 RepID=A0ACC3AF12_9EURO|nr:hypothetical protein H2198_002090 [Knufia sp. JES_112]
MSLVGNEVEVKLSERLPRCDPSFSLASHALSSEQDELKSIGKRLAHASVYADDMSDDDSASVTSSIMTSQVPALTRGNSIASSSGTSMHTDMASVLQGGYVLESEDGVLTLPQSQPADSDIHLLCPFQILDCVETFSDVREFKTHVFSHFRGHPTLPNFAPCFLCDERFHQASDDDPALAWNSMLSHMVHAHYGQGQEYGTIRADFGLMRWMYDRKIINDHDFKRTQVCPQPVVLPSAGMTASMMTERDTPTAPSPPRSPTLLSSPLSEASVPASSSSTGYHGQAYVTFAGARAERRRRESLRPIFQRHARSVS